MIEIGTVTKHLKDRGAVGVQFAHLSTEAECTVLQPTTGENTLFILPSIGTQVVCWLESGKNIALGAVFSESEKPSAEVSAEGLCCQVGGMTFAIDQDKATFENSSTSLRKVLEELLKIVSNLTVSTPNGPSGTPLPPTVQAVEQLKQTLSTFFK